MKLVAKPVYTYFFGENGPIPLKETRYMLQEDLTETFREHELMRERIIKRQESGGVASAEGVEKDSDQNETNSPADGKTMVTGIQKRDFSLSYFNPVTNKTDVIHTQSDTIKIDIANNPVDRSLSQGSTYSIYKYITTPIITQKLDPYILKEIRSHIEVGEPKPFGGGSAIPIIKVEEASKRISDIVAIERTRSDAKYKFTQVIRRKRRMEKRVESEIVEIEKAVKDLEKGKTAEESLKKLNESIRARVLLKMKKKKLSEAVLSLILVGDLKFLKELKTKLRMLTLKDLIDLAKVLRKIKEK